MTILLPVALRAPGQVSFMKKYKKYGFKNRFAAKLLSQRNINQIPIVTQTIVATTVTINGITTEVAKE